MFYLKNVPQIERVVRGVLGALLLAYAVINWDDASVGSVLAATGGAMVLTGLVGFCPICAMVGRRLDKEA